MKTALTVLLFWLTAIFALADKCEVTINYKSDLYGTNYVVEVEPNSGLFELWLPKHQDNVISRLIVSHSPEQIIRFSKNRILLVGVDESTIGNHKKLQTCEQDVYFIDSATFDWCNHTKKLLNSNATKAAIRNQIAEAAASLEAGDTFFYYHSAAGFEDSAIECYDDYYSGAELMADLESFKLGVNIIIMIDGQSKMANAATAKVTHIIAGDKPAKIKTELSPLTYAFLRSYHPLSDTNEDGLLSFQEMATRAALFLNSAKLYDKVKMLSYNLPGYEPYFSRYPSKTSEGTFWHNNNSVYVRVPNITCNTLIYLEEAPRDDDCVVAVPKSKYTWKKGKDKFTFEFFVKDFSFDTPSFQIDYSLLVPSYECKINKRKTSYTYPIENYQFEKKGTFQFKEKNGYTVGKLKVSDFSINFDPTLPINGKLVTLRCFYDRVYSLGISYYVTANKSGTSLTAKGSALP